MAAAFRIEAGDDVFVDDAENIVGHVRRAGAREIVVFVEDKGDFTLPRDVVASAASNRVVVRCAMLPVKMRAVIGHLHGATAEEDA
jgi:hypothetical protein